MKYRLNYKDKIYSDIFSDSKEAEAYIPEFKTLIKEDKPLIIVEYITELNLQTIYDLTKQYGANKAMVIIILKDKVRMTKKEIQNALDLSAPTISRILGDFQNQIEKEVESLQHGVQIYYKLKEVKNG
ncbi:MAG: hypothetical protein PHU54_02545 [Candidatus Omnitrophica bacterium]|nr:hypothetical protein [Candidatus Omnitrophota bacterium]